MIAKSRLHQLGWIALLAICLGLFLALSFQTHSVRSEVLLAEREIIALERETSMLETEFQTRASQRQLADWNAVEFGYSAPRADQYLENERQLASLGSEERPDAPTPLRVARNVPASLAAGEAADIPQIAMVSPVTGKPITLEVAARAQAEASFGDSFSEFLSNASLVREARAADSSGLGAGE